MEAERARVNSAVLESKESSLLASTEKLEKTRDDVLFKVKELERVNFLNLLFVSIYSFYRELVETGFSTKLSISSNVIYLNRETLFE